MPPPQPPPQPPKDSGTSPAIIALIILVVFAVLGIGGCLICLGVGALSTNRSSTPPPKPVDKVSVFVLCDGSPKSGFSCTVSHTGGSRRATACWDIRVSCHNGVLVTGHACQPVAPKGKATRFVRSSDLTNASRCNGAASTAVENVTATPVN